jgi:hypothetical protein
VNDSQAEEREASVARERAIAKLATPKKSPPLFQTEAGTNVIDLVGAVFHPDLPAHRRYLIYILLFGIGQRSLDIRFEPWRFEPEERPRKKGCVAFRLLYMVDGQLSELPPLPCWAHRLIAQDLEILAGLNRTRRRLANAIRRLADWCDGKGPHPRTGRFRARLGTLPVAVDVTVWRGERGDRYFLTLASGSEAAQSVARLELELFQRPPGVRLCPDLR